MRVVNRSDGVVVYSLPELRIRRSFAIDEVKDIPKEELETLWQQDGGAALIKNYLLVDDKEWVEAHWDAPIEYFWRLPEIQTCILTDSVELFKETLSYAPEAVIDLIKRESWRLPMTDLNKIHALKEATGFDVQAVIKNMGTPEDEIIHPQPKRGQRLRQA